MKLTPSSEDYLKAILMLSEDRRVVRVKDLANKLGVTMSSVVSAMHSLAAKGFVVHERYGYLELTAEGRKVAEEVLKRHSLLFHFFYDILGVDKDLSNQDACKVEHQVSQETLNSLAIFIDIIEKETDVKELRKKIREFERYIQRDGKR